MGKPEVHDTTERKWPAARIIIALTGILPIINLLVNWDTLPLLYLIFVLAYVFQKPLGDWTRSIRVPPQLKFAILCILFGWVAECFAWTGNYMAKNPEPALLHPQLIPDLILGIGYYGGWALAWAVMLSLIRFSIPAMYITLAAYGLIFEQNMTILKGFFENFATQPFASTYWVVYVSIVYGSILCSAYLPVKDDIKPLLNRDAWWSNILKIPAAFVVTHYGVAIVITVFGWVTDILGVIPERKSIVEFPFY